MFPLSTWKLVKPQLVAVLFDGSAIQQDPVDRENILVSFLLFEGSCPLCIHRR